MATVRKTIRPSVRFDVFKRDAFTCSYCGGTPPKAVLEIDHIIALANNGTDDPANLTTSCFDCNRGKAARPLDDVPPTLAAQMEERLEREEQVKLYNLSLQATRDYEEMVIGRLAEYWFANIRRGDGYTFGQDRVRSVRIFLRDLVEVELLDAIDRAGKIPATLRDDDDRWRYFCGIAWAKIREGRGGGGR